MVPARRVLPDPQVAPAPVVALVRLVALECRAAPRPTLQACAVVDPDADAGDYVVALVRAMQGGADRRMVFWRPGTMGLSFDETWLTALTRAASDGDSDSLRFLLSRRLRPGAIPVVRLLVQGLADRLGPPA